MSKRKKIGAVVLLLLLLTVMVSYMGLIRYYQDNFMLNTWINGVYCTGKSVEQVNRELLAGDPNAPSELAVTVLSGSGEQKFSEVRRISYEEIGYREDYTESLKAFLQQQDVWLWGASLFQKHHSKIEPSASFEEERLRAWWESSGGMADCREESRDCEIRCQAEPECYVFYDGTKNFLDEERAYELVKEACGQRRAQIDLIGENCYISLDYTEEQLAARALWEKLDSYQRSGFTYELGDERLKLGAGQMNAFLEKDAESRIPVLDASGNLVLSEEAIRSFVEELADRYDTYGKEWHFTSTAGEEITLQGGTYGTLMDREQETAWLTNYLELLVRGELACAEEQALPLAAQRKAVSSETPESGVAPGSRTAKADGAKLAQEETVIAVGMVHVPAYSKDAFCRNRTNWGDTYVEIDMGLQHFYCYIDGEIKLETDVVTGTGGRTPEGINFVYNKQRNRVLRGPGYAAPVSYWMPVIGNIGIHDSNWRREFGGSVYVRNGSHGCINISKTVMPDIYELVELGTPVIMFYGEHAAHLAE